MVIVRPEMVTVLPSPTLALSKTPAARSFFSLTTSPSSTPTRVALVKSRRDDPTGSVASVSPSYTFSSTVISITVNTAVPDPWMEKV